VHAIVLTIPLARPKIYELLNIKGLEERGESFYNPFLSDVIKDLEEQGLAEESEGAKVVYLEGVSII
jgi:arginyl-tRNA synthetase